MTAADAVMTADDPAGAVGHRFAALDAVRAAGAAMVLLTHCAFNTGRINVGWTGAALSRLDVGVALFFVVSGFLLALPWFVASARGSAYPSVGHYLWKRGLRILPLYWLVVVVALLVDPANRGASWGTWLSHLTLTQLYRPAPLASSLTQMWSLCTEVAFYLVLPLLVRWLTPRGRLDTGRVVRRSAVLAAIGLAWAAYAGQVAPTVHAAQWLPGYLPWFLVGVVLAALRLDPGWRPRLDRVAADLPGWWTVAIGVFAISCTPLVGPRLLTPPTAWEGLLKCALYAVVAGCLVLPLVFGPEQAGAVRRVLVRPVPRALGEISYGVFCLHMLVLVQGMRLAGIEVFTGGFWPVTAGTAVVSVAAAGASYTLLERRAMRLKNRGVLARRDPAASASDGADVGSGGATSADSTTEPTSNTATSAQA